MRLLSSAALFNLFVTLISGRNLKDIDGSHRYIIKHENNQNPVGIFSSTEISDIGGTTRYDIGEQSFTIANLTNQQVARVKKTFKDCLVELDKEINIPSDIDYQPVIEVSEEPQRIYLNDAPRCNAIVDNIDIYVVDSVIFTQLSEFSDVSIVNLPSGVSSEPCHAHGTEVASVIVGKNVGVITHGDRRVYGVGVFNCDGRGSLSSLINALNTVSANDKLARKEGRRSIVNFSGTSDANSFIDSLFNALYKSGIPVFAAAGNYASNACTLNSPARATGVYTVGATQYPGDTLAAFSNYGSMCVEAFLPGNPVTVVNVYSGIRSASGTSFSSPIGAAEGAIELSYDLKATPDQVYKRITDRTVKVNQANGPIQIMLAKDACPTNKKIFTKFDTTVLDNNKFNSWYSTRNSDSPLCVSFLVKFSSTKGYATIGLRQSDADLKATTIQIGKKTSAQVRKKNRNNKFEHFVKYNGTDLSHKNTNYRVINTANNRLIQIEQANNTMTISYTDKKNKIKLLSFVPETDYKEIAFSAGAGARVRYSNAMAC